MDRGKSSREKEFLEYSRQYSNSGIPTIQPLGASAHLEFHSRVDGRCDLVVRRVFTQSEMHKSNSRRHSYRCRDWDETSGVIRFDLMCAHTIDRPISRRGTHRYVMARCRPSLPVQDDCGRITPRTSEANIEKCLLGNAGTGNIDGVRSAGSDHRQVKSQVSND